LHLLLFVFLLIDILTKVRWNLSIVLICIFFMAKDAEHFFICLLAICTTFFENCLIYLPIYWLDYFIFGAWFDVIPFINSYSYFPSFCVPVQKVIAYAWILRCFSCFSSVVLKY
jgi:hypothetical protein